MAKSITIDKNPTRRIDQDFEALRLEGIGWLERLSSDNWTDFNTHDPGITLLESICFAITDLAYRVDLPDADLFAAPTQNLAAMHQQFLSAKRVLPTAPITVQDYRKLIIDVEGVRNAWLFPAQSVAYFADCRQSQLFQKREDIPANHPISEVILGGIYDILLDLDDTVQTPEAEKRVFKAVRAAFHANRNLCEDLGKIGRIPIQTFMVCTEIELFPEADMEAVHAQILFDIEQFVAPGIRRFHLSEMLEKGLESSEIYDGPLLNFGFIDPHELEKSALPPEQLTIRTSDILRIIMSVPGVETVRKIHLNYAGFEKINDAGLAWSIDLKPRHLPRISADSPIRFYKDLLPFQSNKTECAQKLAALNAASRAHQQSIFASEKEWPMPLGRFRDAGKYLSMLRDLPKTYGVSAMGLPAHASHFRRMQARQLQGFLLIFEELLSGAFGQLGQLQSIFDARKTKLPALFFQQIFESGGSLPTEDLFKNAGNLAEILKNPFQNEIGLENFASKWNEKSLENRNRQLDHLLARFGENLNEYVVTTRTFSGQKHPLERILIDKSNFLADIEWTSRNRAQAMDFCNKTQVLSDGFTEIGLPKPLIKLPLKRWYEPKDVNLRPEQLNSAGIERRVGRLIGLHHVSRRNLADIQIDFEESHDAATLTNWRFRVLDEADNKALLTAKKGFATENEMLEALRLAVFAAMDRENYELKTAANGRLFFNIVQKEGVLVKILAKQKTFFDSETAREEAIFYLQNYLSARYEPEGLFVIEHLLLRPATAKDPFLSVCCDPDCASCETIDPYSFRVNVVLPAFAPRFKNMNFRRFVEKTIREEMPAHVVPRICWIAETQMTEFEKAYRDWLEYRHFCCHNPPNIQNQTLKKLIEVLENLRSVYPIGTLHDCEEGSDEHAIVLGQTQIGNLVDPSND